MTLEEKQMNIRLTALLLATKISKLEKEGDVNMWDEIIAYLQQREPR